MYGVIWQGGSDSDGWGYADVANVTDAEQVARAMRDAGYKEVAYWNIDGRSATSAEIDVSLLSLPQLEAKFVR